MKNIFASWKLRVEVAKGRVPVLAGAGGYNTAEVITLARELAAIGRERNSFRHTVLQQADAGRFVPAFQGDRGGRQYAGRFFTACRDEPASTSSLPR